jgi:hypothetical protein
VASRCAAALSVALAMLACTRLLASSPGPPPDPRKGERSDGRVHDRLKAADFALAIPRIVLTPPRMLIGLVGQVARGVYQLDYRHHIAAKLYRLTTSEDGLIALRPLIRYYTGFSPIFGFTLFDNRSLGKRSHMEASIAVGLPQVLLVSGTISPSLPLFHHFSTSVDFARRDDQAFYGIAQSSYGGARPNDLPGARYGIDAVNVTPVYSFRLTPIVRLNFAEMWGYRSYRDGRSFGNPPISVVYCTDRVIGNAFPDDRRCLRSGVDATLVPGFFTGANFFATTAELVVDTRDGDAAPTRGLRFDLGGRYAHGVTDGRPSWIQVRSSLTGVIRLGAPGRTLVLHLRAEMLEPLSDSPVPFTELVTLGGVDDLRGFPFNRFRDYSSLLATVEYRYQVWMWADASIFVDYGGVFGKRFDGFGFDRMVPDVGVGLRLHSRSNFVVRLQLAYGFGEGLQAVFATSTGL